MKRTHRYEADQDLPVAGGRVDQLHRVDEGAPVELLDESGDGSVEPKHVVGHDQVGVDREEYEEDQGGGPEPAPGSRPGLTGQDLLGSLLGFGQGGRGVPRLLAHRRRITCIALSSAVMVAGVRPS
jgi:hypothetical protein